MGRGRVLPVESGNSTLSPYKVNCKYHEPCEMQHSSGLSHLQSLCRLLFFEVRLVSKAVLKLAQLIS